MLLLVGVGVGINGLLVTGSWFVVHVCFLVVGR